MLKKIKKHKATVEFQNRSLESDNIVVIENGTIEAEFNENTATIKIISSEKTMDVKISFNKVN